MASNQDVLSWLASKDGQRTDTDGMYGAQCKDLANAYASWLGHPLTAGDAHTAWDQAQDTWWQKIPNTPSFVPQLGDIFVMITSTLPYGHIGIVKSGSAQQFMSLDQNWVNFDASNGSPAAYVVHNFEGVVGFLRPKLNEGGDDMPTMSTVDLSLKLAEGLAGRNPNDPKVVDEIKKNHIRPLEDEVRGWFDDPTAGEQYRKQIQIWRSRSDHLGDVEAALTTLQQRLNDQATAEPSDIAKDIADIKVGITQLLAKEK